MTGADKAREEAWLRWAGWKGNPKMPKKGSAPAKTPGEAFRAGYDAGWEAAQKQAALQHILREDASLLDKLADLEAAEKKPL